MRSINISEKSRGKDWALQTLDKCEYAFLALAEGDTPYCVPISPLLIGETIYFHSSPLGRKVKIIESNPAACITCVEYAERNPEIMSMKYRSVQANGVVERVSDLDEKRQALYGICMKFAPGNSRSESCSLGASEHVSVYKMRIAAISGKESV